MTKKFGGKTFSSESDFGLNRDFDPWATSSTPGSDATGPTRGAGAYSADDAAFRKPSQSQTDGHSGAREIAGDVLADQGPGPYGAGGSAVREVGGGSGKPRFGSKSSAQAVKDQTNGGV